jgi:hypothetical protein
LCYLLVAYPAKKWRVSFFAPSPCKIYYPSRICTLLCMEPRYAKHTSEDTYLLGGVGLRVSTTFPTTATTSGAWAWCKLAQKKGGGRSPHPVGYAVGSVTHLPVEPCARMARCCVPMQALQDAHGTNSILSLNRGSDGQDRVPFRLLKCV